MDIFGLVVRVLSGRTGWPGWPVVYCIALHAQKRRIQPTFIHVGRVTGV